MRRPSADSGILLEKYDLCGRMLDAVNLHLEAKRIKIATGTIVDAKLSKQVQADLAAAVDWDATYSGCDIDVYLHGFSEESIGVYSQEQRTAADISAAMHTRAGMRSPTGAAPVAARLAMYASLLDDGAPALPGSPSQKEAAALSRRIRSKNNEDRSPDT